MVVNFMTEILSDSNDYECERHCICLIKCAVLCFPIATEHRLRENYAVHLFHYSTLIFLDTRRSLLYSLAFALYAYTVCVADVNLV